jgi:hypothetical protein
MLLKGIQWKGVGMRRELRRRGREIGNQKGGYGDRHGCVCFIDIPIIKF